jgi:Na+(H+)/acetate symporter ActP
VALQLCSYHCWIFWYQPPGFVAAVVALALDPAASFPLPLSLVFFDKKMNKEGAVSGW